MGVRAVSFLGRSYLLPGGYSAWRAKPQPTGISPDLNTQIIIGPADNGWCVNDTNADPSQRIMEFGSFQEAKAILKSGDLLDAIKAAFSPSKDSRFSSGPVLVKALNVCDNDVAAGTVTNTSSGTYPIAAVIPGPYGNDIRFRVSSSGDKVEIGDSSGIESITGLDVVDAVLTYSGDAVTAVLAWNGTTFSVTLAGQTDGSTSLSIAAAGLTLRQLADKVNAATGYSMVLNVGDDALVSNLDHYSSVNAKTGASLKSLLYRQTSFIASSGFAVVTVSGARHPLAAMTAFAYLTGGATGSPSTNDWISAIEYQTDQAICTGLYINVCTDVPAVGAALFSAIATGNSPGGKNERFGGYGGKYSDTFTTRLANGKAVDSEYMVYGVSPVTLYKADGVTLKTYDGWMLAVLHNAIKASTNVRESAIYKDLNIVDCPEKLTQTQLGKAIQAGVLTVDRKPNNGAFKITYDVTTTGKNNLILNKAQTVCTALALAKDLRESLEEQFLGETPTDPSAVGTVLTDADIRTFIEQKFDQDYVKNFGWLTRNIYTGAPAWNREFTIQRDGNVMYFIFPDGTLVTSIDYMFSLLNFSLVQGSSNG
jgi:hypothetical protein